MTTFHYAYGNFINIEIGQEMTVARCGGFTKFGEPATLTRTTKQHLVFTTESGQTVECPIDNVSFTTGKAHQAGYFLLAQKFEDINDIIRSAMTF